MTQTLPAKRIEKEPKFNFAVLSIAKDSEVAELESSFVSESDARRIFGNQYSKWGLTATNFYLVDWEKQTVLLEHLTF